MVDENCNNAPCFLVKDLTERVEKMEHAIVELDKKTTISEVILDRVERAFASNTEALGKNTEVIGSMKETMIVMQGAIRNNAEITQKIEKKVDELDTKFDASEEKAKTDFRLIWKEFIGSKIVWLIGGGLLISIVELITRVDWSNFLK